MKEALALIFFFLALRAPWALPVLGPLPPYFNAFGFSVSDSPTSPYYLKRGLELRPLQGVPDGDILAASSGSLLFVQTESFFPGQLPRPAGGMGAYSHADGIVLVYSGPGFNPDPGLRSFEAGIRLGSLAAGENGARAPYSLSIYDSRAAAWMNPQLLSPQASDKQAPRIGGIALARSGARVDYSPSAKQRTRIKQGTYSLYVQAYDPLAGGLATGVYRYKASMDGRVMADHALDSASAAEKGLSFLGFAAPSTSILDRDGALKLASISIPRGQHILEITVLDFAGLKAVASWRLEAE